MTLEGPLSFPFFPPALEAKLPSGPSDVTTATPTTSRRQQPLIEPTILRETGANRAVRISEKLSDLVNTLIRNGSLVRTRSGWDVRPRRHYYERAPTAGDDDRVEAWEGDFWYDTSANAVYACLSANRGAAVWVLLGMAS